MLRSFFLKVLRGTLTLVVLLAVWCGVLWWLIAPDLASLSWPETAALHAGPPLLFWGGRNFWVGYDRRRQSAAADKQAQVAEQDRLAALSAARSAREAALRRRRFSCDCRAVAIVRVMGAVDSIEDTVPVNTNVHLSTRDDSDSVVASSLLEHLRPAIEEALAAIYASCPAAMTFPIYLTPPPDVFGEDALALVRKHRQASIHAAGNAFVPEARLAETANAVSFLPLRGSAADSAIETLEDHPELPGLVLLAFDSPWWRAQTETVNFDRDVARNNGVPAEGAFSLVLTRPELSSRLSVVYRCESPANVMTPYWEMNRARDGVPAQFQGLSEMSMRMLSENEALARIHRAAAGNIVHEAAHRHDLVQSIEGMIKEAQVNSAQIDLLFDSSENQEGDQSISSDSGADCGWIVHSAGVAERGGHRLASFGAAMYSCGIDVDPIAAASNACAVFGDVGCARQVAMLALTVARTAGNRCGTLCADFEGKDRLSIFFAMPPASAKKD